MSRNRRSAAIKSAAALMAIAATGVLASPAMANTTTDTVTGTVQPSLSLAVSTPAGAFTTGFQPGGTANSAGALLITDTNATPALTAQDVTSLANKGHMQPLLACTGSAAFLASPLSVTVTGTGVTSFPISLSGATQTVATAAAPVSAAIWSTAYQQAIGAGETLAAGCVYTVTTTYTLS
jgi:hypothetical protein